MFFSRQKSKTTTDQLEQPHIPLACPTATIPALNPAEKQLVENYTNIAQHIGFDPFPLQYKRLMLFLKENDLPVFDYNKVAEYLESKLEKDQHWQWTPLREQDMEPITREGKYDPPWYGPYYTKSEKGIWTHINNEYYESVWYYCCGMTCPHQHYNKLVPRAVLTQVAKIAAEFPTARFYVSEIANEIKIVNYPDPFVSVSFETRYDRADQITRIIFAAWDEPGW